MTDSRNCQGSVREWTPGGDGYFRLYISVAKTDQTITVKLPFAIAWALATDIGQWAASNWEEEPADITPMVIIADEFRSDSEG
jgi:hypothetical protein